MTASIPLMTGGPDDQATQLRALVRAAEEEREPIIERPAAPRNCPRPARVIAVASGKGGVGKTNLSVNLSILFARAGFRTSLIDADLGLANADVLCGLTPRARLDSVLRRESADFNDLAIEGPGGFRLIPGAVGVARFASLDEDERSALVDGLEQLEALNDVLVVDTAAGIGPGVLAFVRAADLGVVVCTPDPTSIADAYALVKCLIRPQAGDVAVPGRPPPVTLVVNGVTDAAEARRVHARLERVARQFIAAPLPLLGWVTRDMRVVSSIRERKPVVLAHPRCRASRDLADVAGRLARVASMRRTSEASNRTARPGFAFRLLRITGSRSRTGAVAAERVG